MGCERRKSSKQETCFAHQDASAEDDVACKFHILTTSWHQFLHPSLVYSLIMNYL